MGDINRVALFGKLNSLAYRSIESATVFCKLRGNPYVELVHWFHQILQQPNSDMACIVRAFGIDEGGSRRTSPRRSTGCRAGQARFRIFPLTSKMPRTRVGVVDAEVWRDPDSHRARAARDPENAVAEERAGWGFARARESEAGCSGRRLCAHYVRLARGRAERDRWFAACRTGGARRGEWRDAAGTAGQAGSAEALHHRSHGTGAAGKDRSGRGPRRRDSSDRRHSHAPSPEQPDSHGRGGRRQDGCGGRFRAPYRGRRRSAVFERRVAPGTRRRPSASRREHEGRVRAAPAPGHR